MNYMSAPDLAAVQAAEKEIAEATGYPAERIDVAISRSRGVILILLSDHDDASPWLSAVDMLACAAALKKVEAYIATTRGKGGPDGE